MLIPVQHEVIPLWPKGTPADDGSQQVEQESFNPMFGGIMVIRNVTEPTLTAFLPDPAIATGAAIINCPGGGFFFLNMANEGVDVARWLTALGIAVFVLKYRLMPTPSRDEDFLEHLRKMRGNHAQIEQMKMQSKISITDGQQAVRVVRHRAADWGIDPKRIGIMGFSAGGVVTTGATLEYTPDSRPDLAAMIYAPAWQELIVPADVPPLFLAMADDDALLVGTSSPINTYSAWKAAGQSVELHIYAKGGHGFAMWQQNLPCDQWLDRFGDWLRVQGILG